jgi:hypothetical protein
MKKPRSDSKLLNLPAHQQDRIRDWLIEGVGDGGDTSYSKVKEQIHLDFGISCSVSALTDFYQRVCAPWRLRQAADAADALPETAGGLMAHWDESSKALIKQHYFQLLASKNPDPKQLVLFASQVADFARGDLEREKLRTVRQRAAVSARLKRADQRLSERRVKLLEKKVSDAQKTLSDPSLSMPEREARMKEMFGITG